MNLYLIEIIIKFLRMLFIAFISFFNICIYAEKENVTENSIISREKYAVNTVVLKEEIKQNTTNDKVSYIKTNNTQAKVENKAVNNEKSKVSDIKKVENIKTNNEIKQEDKSQTNNELKQETNTQTNTSNSVIETFTGRLTGYGPDCAGCSGYGNLACRTKNKKTFSLKTDGIYYTDSEFGKVRILAAATTKFKCGTIITVTKEGQTPFDAIVLDTGGSMRKAWSEGSVWMDLAYETEAMAGNDNLTGRNIKFEVKRYGW